MQYKKLLGLLLTIWLACGSFSLDAKTSRRSGKGSAAKSAATSKKSTKPSASSKKAPTSSKSRKAATTRARRSGPPRQSQPTPERYKEIQQALADKGYYTGPIDGAWDAGCVDALKRFQADQNLSPDGKLGSLSLIGLGLGPKREPLPPQFDSKPEPAQ